METNFQKASCTLEAGVKIYSMRVDSVHSEAYKVLGGITRVGQQNEPDNVMEDANVSNGQEEGNSKKEQERKVSPLSTLESSFEALNVKKFDVAFAVDPLYHQTSAQFDEGGAKGLLLNNLGVYGGCQEACNQIAEVVQEALKKMEMVADEKMRMFKKAHQALEASELELDEKASELELDEKAREVAELKLERQRKKQQIDELESIARLKQAEADMFQLKADEARQEAERLQRITLAKAAKSEEYAKKYLELRLNEAEAEKLYLFQKIRLQNVHSISVKEECQTNEQLPIRTIP